LEHQTYPAARFELVVVDDGGTDGAGDVVRRYAAGAPVRMRYLRQERAGLAKARNLGVHEAKGRYVLFMDVDVLACPGLLERHVLAHQRGGKAGCFVGTILMHPRITPGTLTRWFLPEDQRKPRADEPLYFLDCQSSNMSLPRQLFSDMGGFSEVFRGSEFAGAELAWRLAKEGILSFLAETAHGYIWLPADFEAERRRQYARGYALFRLREITGSREITRRYFLRRDPFRALLDAMVMPFYVRACQQSEQDTRLLGAVYRRILRYEYYCGYHDARKGRPSREDLPQT